MSEDIPNRRSLVEYEHVASVAAREAVANVFALLGIDISKQEDINTLRDTLIHARKIQRLSERAGVMAVFVVGTAVLSGALTFLWSGVVHALKQ